MKKREADYRDGNKMVVHNNFVRAVHPERMNINAMKLFRLVVTQCRMNDDKFYEYEFKLSDLAAAFDISGQNLYRDVQEMCKNMVQMILYIGDGNARHRWEYKPIFRTCFYEPTTGIITAQISDDMTDLFLKLKKNFTSVPIGAILTMRSKYGIRLFEVICDKLRGHFPYAAVATEITLSLDEIRKATGTEKKKTYDILTNLRKRILEPAFKDIEENMEWKIITKDIKRGRKITGLSLEIWSAVGYEMVERSKQTGQPLPGRFKDQLPGQMSLFDNTF